MALLAARMSNEKTHKAAWELGRKPDGRSKPAHLVTPGPGETQDPGSLWDTTRTTAEFDPDHRGTDPSKSADSRTFDHITGCKSQHAPLVRTRKVHGETGHRGARVEDA